MNMFRQWRDKEKNMQADLDEAAKNLRINYELIDAYPLGDKIRDIVDSESGLPTTYQGHGVSYVKFKDMKRYGLTGAGAARLMSLPEKRK